LFNRGLTRKLTVGGTVTVAVTVAAVALEDWLEAADPQDSFWVEHSSKEKPGPSSAVQLVNCSSQAAPQARVMSSKSCSRTKNWSPFLETEGGRPPRPKLNSKNDSITVTFLTMVVETTDAAEVVLEPLLLPPLATEDTALPLPTTLTELVLAVSDEVVVSLFPFPFFPLFEEEVLAVSDEEVVVSLFPFPFFPLFAEVVVAVSEEELVVSLFPFPFFPLFDELVLVATSDEDAPVAACETLTSGPTDTAAAAAAAAAIPLEPSLAATLMVVPLPTTVNLVQSSGVPR